MLTIMLTHAIVNCGLISFQKMCLSPCGEPILGSMGPVTEGTVDVLLHFADGHTILVTHTGPPGDLMISWMISWVLMLLGPSKSVQIYP